MAHLAPVIVHARHFGRDLPALLVLRHDHSGSRKRHLEIFGFLLFFLQNHKIHFFNRGRHIN
jgi:hypothetical protein